MKSSPLKIIAGLCLVAGMSFTSSCYYDNVEELHPRLSVVDSLGDTTGTVTYTNKIAPLMTKYCVTCHNSSPSSQSFDLSTYDLVSQQMDINLMDAIQGTNGFELMPKGATAPIKATYIAVFQKWKDTGKLN